MKKPGIPSPGDAGVVTSALSPAAVAALAEAAANLEQQRAERLDALGAQLAKKRSEAIAGRQNQGIDQQWQEDIEYYEGIDDANRGDMESSWRTKPPGQALPPTSTKGEVRSNVFVNVTRPYCDAAAARIGDMLMPTDDRSFSIKPTPVPELLNIAQGKLSLSARQSILSQADQQSQSDEQAKATVMQFVSDAMQKAQSDIDDAKARAEKAQTRIDDWFVECQYHGEVRKVIDDCARMGTGILKGPVPVKRKNQKVVSDNGVMALVIQEEIAPASRRIDPLNFFPDPACGESIHNGSYTWERDYLTRRSLQKLKGTPGYIDSQIDQCLIDGPQKATADAPEPQGKTQVDIKDLYEIWYYHGIIEKDDLDAMGCECDDQTPDVVYALLTMVNNRVIKGVLNPLDNGEFPYDVMVWQRQAGKWTGIGVSRQIRTPQRIVNAATRNMLDNAGLSGGPQIVMKLGVITPADGDYTLTPRKIWYASADVDLADLNGVFRTYQIESKQQELMAIIQFGLKLAEDVTGLPLLLQGQQGQAPDTLGGMQMLNNNSSTVLRRLAKLFDDCITEPHVRRYYFWLMQYGEDESEKGDFQIDARGSSALVERDIQNQAVVQMGNIVSNPAFGVDPKKWFAEYCKSQRLDPKSFQYSEEDQKRIDEAQAKGPTDPRVAAAQLRADVDRQIAALQEQSKERIVMLEQQFQHAENQAERQLKILLTEIENASKENITLNDLKTRLADTAMKVRAQRDLSAMSNAVDLHKHATAKVLTPPTEPVGRAPAGQAFQR